MEEGPMKAKVSTSHGSHNGGHGNYCLPNVVPGQYLSGCLVKFALMCVYAWF